MRRCSALVGKTKRFRGYRCNHPGTIKVGRKWYCGRHDPHAVILRKAAWRARWLRRTGLEGAALKKSAKDLARDLVRMIERASRHESKGGPTDFDWIAIKAQARQLLRALRKEAKGRLSP